MKAFFFQKPVRAMWVCCCLLLTSYAIDGLQLSKTERAANDAKVAAWKGRRVRLLDECCALEGDRLYFERDHGSGGYQWHWEGKPDEGIPRSFAGKTGTILDSKGQEGIMLGIAYDSLIELDDPKVRIVGDGDYLGFFDEKAEAEKLIGKVLWAKGIRKLETRAGEVSIANLQPVTVTGAEWGVGGGDTVKLLVKTDSGEEGYLMGVQVDPRFHVIGPDTRALNVNVHMDDPRKRFPSWSPATWDLIRKSMIAIGMTEEQARLTCGDKLWEVGAVLSESGEASPIYACGDNGRRFLMKGGKVVKYVESQ